MAYRANLWSTPMESLPQPIAPQGATAVTTPRQANHDGELISMWLHGRPDTTRRVYQRHVGNFLRLVGKPLATVREACQPPPQLEAGFYYGADTGRTQKKRGGVIASFFYLSP